MCSSDLEHLTIEFPSHFILSIIDVHLDSASRVIFPSAITRILHHFSVPFPSSDHFTVMCAIDYAIVKRREAQLRSWQSDSAAPSSFRSIPFDSIHIGSSFLFERCVSRRYHRTTVAHGCSSQYTLYRVVSGERSCRSYCTTAGVYGWLCS